MQTIDKIVFSDKKLDRTYLSKKLPYFEINRISKTYQGEKWDGRFGGHIDVKIQAYDNNGDIHQQQGFPVNLFVADLMVSQPIMNVNKAYSLDFDRQDDIKFYSVTFTLKFADLKEGEYLTVSLGDTTLERTTLKHLFSWRVTGAKLPSAEQRYTTQITQDAQPKCGVVWLADNRLSRNDGEAHYYTNTYLFAAQNVLEYMESINEKYADVQYTQTVEEAQEIVQKLLAEKEMQEKLITG